MTYYSRTPLTKGTLARTAEVNAQLQAIEESFDTLPTEEQLKRNTTTFAVDTGTVNHIVVALPFPLLAYPGPGEGLEIAAQIANTNTGEADIDVDTLGVVPVKQFNGAVLQAGDLPLGATVKLSWNGDDNEFRLQGASPGNIVAAEVSATAAAASASAASGSASAASGSAAAASSSASTASGHASTALSHANTAAGHASDASNSADAAAAAQEAAEIAQAAAEAAGPTLGTEQATTSGTTKDFPIPAGVKRITVMVEGVSTDGTSALGIQIGGSGGIENTGYSHTTTQIAGSTVGGTSNQTAGFFNNGQNNADNTTNGIWELFLKDAANNTWMCKFTSNQPVATPISAWGSGVKSLAGELTTVRLVTLSNNTFDAGSVNVQYK
jgi:hypothetical protein